MVIYSKHGWPLRDRKFRKSCNWNNEISKNILKSMLSSDNYTLFYRLYFSKMFYIFKSTAAISRYRISCAFSNNGRVIFCHFKLSRLFCKNFASHGFLPGMRKSSF